MTLPQINLNPPHINTVAIRDEIDQVLQSGRIARGSKIQELEMRGAEAFGKNYGVAVSNGTQALELALLACGIGAGDDVLVPTYTYIASVYSILRVGARVIPVDVSDDMTIDVDDAVKKTSKNTRAVIPVDIFGIPSRVPELKYLMQRKLGRSIFVIEDAAQAIGAKYEHSPIGLHADVVTTSFYATKNVAAGEGGLCATDSEGVWSAMLELRSNGMVHFDYNDRMVIGSNYHMNELAAAITLPQIRDLDRINTERRGNAFQYDMILGEPSYSDVNRYCVYHHYPIRIVDYNSRQAIIDSFEDDGIEVGKYYCAEEYKMIRSMGNYATPNAHAIALNTITIPVHHNMTQDEIARVGTKLEELKDVGAIVQA